ncbi:Hemopexin-like domain-containing protein [Aspergillus pseudoustus]|uniref:Hemopexin-like domain-containing protein n=1 Tax=Aspergillus pseudoustus TaxID=1810923 RepID=A0ABR4J1U4_9EURO
MVDAIYYHPGGKHTYAFGGRRYARIDFVPDASEEKITFGPAALRDHWPSLKSIGFGSVEAVLAVEGSPDEAYYFFGGHVARIKVVPSTQSDTVVDGPSLITAKWKSLAQAGFDTIDAAIPVPQKPGEVYFFRGVNYVRVNVDQDKIVFGPAALAKEWPGLTSAGFDSVDAAFPQPDKPDIAYFFKGDRYVKIRVVASAPDQVTWGPKLIADHWKTLDWI